jgi:hypothetical protein
MRHLFGFVLALALAAAVFFGASWGYLRLLRIPVVNGAAATLPAGGGSLVHDKTVLLAFAALAGVGLLAGICVAVPWISPLAAGLANVGRAVRYIPLKSDAFGDGFEALLVNGVLALAGLVLIVPLFIPARWRRDQLPYDDEGPELLSRAPAATSATGSSVLLQNDWGSDTAPISPQAEDQPPSDLWQ